MPHWLRHVRRVTVLLFVAAVASATAPAAERPAVRIAKGVTVAGVKVGGMTSEPARRKLTRRFERPLEFRQGRERWDVPARRFSGASVDDAVSEALRARPRSEVQLRVRVRARAVERYVDRLGRRFFRPAKDTTFAGLASDLTPAFTPAVHGRRVVKKPVVEAIWRALRSGRRREEIRLPTAPIAPKVTPANFGPVVVIRRESKRLLLYDGPRLVQTFGVATGSSQYPTPLGNFSIVDLQRNPWWRPPDSDWAQGAKPIPPGPGNPLGTRWMGISAPAVGIHGTPDAASIGYSVSHGCIRMRIPDAEWLFTQVRIGTPVSIVGA
jgi:lipoprotein-anchoring transpeptidase ErfK/SrfK